MMLIVATPNAIINDNLAPDHNRVNKSQGIEFNTKEIPPTGKEVYTLDEVVIQTTTKRESETALLLDQKKAVEIKQSIGADELSRKGVSDAAGAVAKISGVSKQEGSSNVYVRGLGDRYLNTTLKLEHKNVLWPLTNLKQWIL